MNLRKRILSLEEGFISQNPDFILFDEEDEEDEEDLFINESNENENTDLESNIEIQSDNTESTDNQSDIIKNNESNIIHYETGESPPHASAIIYLPGGEGYEYIENIKTNI